MSHSTRAIARKNERGSASVEAALVMPLTLLAMFGVSEFGSAFYQQQALIAAAREGARAGIVLSTPRPSASDITTIVNNYLTGLGWNASLATTTVTNAGGPSGSDLTVRVTYPCSFPVLSHLTYFRSTVPSTMPGTITLSATVVMRLE